MYAQCTGFVFSGLDEAESTFDIRDHSIAVLTAVFESELDASRGKLLYNVSLLIVISHLFSCSV